MNNTIIRQAKISDAEVICLLGRITFTETFAHYFNHKTDLLEYYKHTFSVDKIRSSIQKPNNIFLLALQDNLPVGYAKVKLLSSTNFTSINPMAQLQKIYVLKDFIGQGIGSSLQSYIFDTLRNKNILHVWLSVFNENENALKFYAKNQFYPIGHHDFQIGSQIFEFAALCKKL